MSNSLRVQDIHGLTLSATSSNAGNAFDNTVMGYIKYRLDTPAFLKETLRSDPEFGLAHCLKGYFLMLAYNQANLPAARESAAQARTFTATATWREQRHVDALEAWLDDDSERMLAAWEDILVDHPLDLMAFRLAHLSYFWLGRAEDMKTSLDRVMPAWNVSHVGYATVMSCKCFAYEECGEYVEAEDAGRAALDIDPGDLWGTHGVAHIMEMQGRYDEGIDFMKDRELLWKGANNMTHHLWWHRALFHIERREFDEVLDLYDNRFRNLSSVITQAQPDLYIDVQNASSMLFRLERQGVPVGDRWAELAVKAIDRIGDCCSAFTLPHWMMALVGGKRFDEARQMLNAMELFGQSEGTNARIVEDVALPVTEAVLAHGLGEYDRAVDLMKPVLDRMPQLGGSHAQQEVLEQVFLDSAVNAKRQGDVIFILSRAEAARPVPLGQRIGFAAAASQG
ncbi:MAG: tetratricopeptide repeat protein [Gemmatimonadota bacterium]|nr:tetratricopeptide repeat protein [Gemmatimonadota bacterium]